MLDFLIGNPFVFFCLFALCWPGPIPLAVLFALSRQYDFQSPFVAKSQEPDI